jgi:O-antigen/teichoic acid export membrane protein
MQDLSSPIGVWRKTWRTRASTRIALHIGIAVVGVMVARGLGLVTQILLARWMGVADFGVYTTIYTLLGPAIMVVSLGLDTWLLRQAGTTTDLDSIIGQVFSLRLLAGGGLMLLAALALSLSGRVALTLPIVFAALALMVELLLTTTHTALRAQVRNTPAALLQVLVAALTVGLLVLLWNPDAPLLTATGYRLLAAVTGLGVGFWLLRGSIRHIYWKVGSLWRMVRQASAYFASDLLSTVALKADLTMVALIIGAIGAGIYGPALTIINTVFLLPTVAWQVLLPLLSRESLRSRGFRRIMLLALAGNATYGLIWAGVLALRADWLVGFLFDAQYLDAGPLLVIMSPIPLLKSLNFCWALLMVARDRQGFRTRLQSIGAAFNVGANLLCIPLFGLIGAAWVNVVTEAVLLACYSYGAWRTVRET